MIKCSFLCFASNFLWRGGSKAFHFARKIICLSFLWKYKGWFNTYKNVYCLKYIPSPFRSILEPPAIHLTEIKKKSTINYITTQLPIQFWTEYHILCSCTHFQFFCSHKLTLGSNLKYFNLAFQIYFIMKTQLNQIRIFWFLKSISSICNNWFFGYQFQRNT